MATSPGVASSSSMAAIPGQKRKQQEDEMQRQYENNLFEIHMKHGSQCLQEGKYEKADAALAKAVELKPENAEAHGGLGVALKEQKKWAGAEQALAKAVELKLEDADTLFWLGDALAEQKKREQAEEAYAKAVKKTSPEETAKRLYAGRVHANNEEEEEDA